jgi:chromosome segregation ATPase
MNVNDWLDNWEREADAFFRKLENVPAELEGEVQKLISWREQARHASDQYAAIRDQLWVQRMERRETAARIKLISKKLNKQVEQEISERELAKWQRELEKIRSQISRVTDNIIRDMRKIRRRQAIEAAGWKMAEAAEARQRAEEDLAMWEAFKTSLEAKQDEIAEPDPKELERLARERTAREQIKQEYEKFLSRPDFDPNDDQSTWENFTNSL